MITKLEENELLRSLIYTKLLIILLKKEKKMYLNRFRYDQLDNCHNFISDSSSVVYTTKLDVIVSIIPMDHKARIQ